MAAGPMLATSISGCSSATGALARRPILPSNSAWQSTCPKNVSAARAGRNGASRRRRLFRGEAREKRRLASAKGASWRARTAAFVSFRPWLRSGELWPEACTCVRCPCAHPFTHPFAGCMAGREGSDKARGLNADGPAVAALPSWGSPCRRTHPQPSHHVAGVWAVRVGVCSALDLL